MPNPYGQYMGGYAPMAHGIEHNPMTGFDGLPMMDNPVLGTAAMFVQPAAANWMNNAGMTPIGLSGKNITDVLSNMRYTEHQNEVMSRMAASDRSSVIRTMKGAAAVAGKSWNAEREAAANSMADAYQNMAPIVGRLSTDALDAITGGTSAVAMSIGVMKGARYRADPMNGLPGTSTDGVSHLTEGLHASYFEGGKFDRAKNFGFSSGQIGALFDEMSRRGMVAGTGSAQDAAMGGLSMLENDKTRDFGKLLGDTLGATRAGEIMNKAQSTGKDMTSQLSSTELQKLAATGEGSDAIKGFDVSRVKASIDKYAKLTAAMRDIFGDAGHPNAPMGELIQGLEAMTNGSLQHLSTGRTEMLVRQTYALAKSSGIGLEGAMIMNQYSAQAAAGLGLESGMAPGIGLTGIAALHAAQQSGIGGLNQWGAMNAEQMGQAMINRTARAAGSEMGNRMGALGVLEEQLKMARGKGFAADSNIGRMLEAAKEGRTSFEFTDKEGKVQTRNILDFAGRKNAAEFKATVEAESGGMITGRDVDRQERDLFANQEQLAEHGGIQESVGKMSSEETGKRVVGTAIANDLRTRLKGRGSASDQRALAERMSMYLESATGDPEKLVSDMSQMLRESGLAEGMSDEQVRMIAAQQVTTTNTARRDAKLGNRVSNAQMNNKEFRSQYDAGIVQSSIDAHLRSSLTGVGSNTSMIQRMIQAVQKQGDGPVDAAALNKVLFEAIGGQDSAEIAAALRDPLEKVSAAQQAYTDAAKGMDSLGRHEEISPGDSEKEKQRKREANAKRKEALETREQAAAQLGKTQQTLHSEIQKYEKVATEVNKKDDGQVASDPSRRTDDASAGAPQVAAAGQGGRMHMEGTLKVDMATGQGMLVAQGTPRGSVPTGVS